MRGFLPEILLASMLCGQFLALLPGMKWNRLRLHSALFILGMAAVFLFSFLLLHADRTELFTGALSLDELFRLPRAVIALAALMLGTFVLSSETLPAPRKPEILFMITTLCLLGRVLLLSQNYLVSFLCLFGMAITALFLTGLSFRSAGEGEATLKWWFQLGIFVIFGFGALLGMLLLVGGLQYGEIGTAIQGLSRESALLLTLLFLFPFLVVAGLFPLHFLVIDRDHGAPWGAQAVCSILVSGVATLAMLKAGIVVYHNNELGGLSLRILERIAVISAFWCCLGAYTQKNVKRFLAFFSSSQWAVILLISARPSALSLSAAVYYFIALSLSLSLVYPTLAAFHERVGDDEMSSAYGMGRHNRAVGVILLSGLCFFLFVPPFMGFPALLYSLAVLFEQQSVWRILNFTLLQLLYVFVAAHLLANIFFRDGESKRDSRANRQALPQYSKMSLLVGGLIVVVLLFGGIFWEPILGTLSAAAKNFII